MKSFKQILLASTATFAIGIGAAYADPVTFLPAGAVVQFKYNNLENLVTQEGQILNGIFNVSSINDTGGNPYWASGISDGTALTGRFDNLTVASITGSAGNFQIYFTGGTLAMYNVPAGSFKPTDELLSIPSQICGGACPTPWLTADFALGGLSDNPLTTFDESTTTLFSTLTSATLQTPTGSGDGLLELTGGTAAGRFQDGTGPDFSIQSGLQGCPGTGQYAANCLFNRNTWAVASFDPVTGSTVPEPGSMALLGLALAGLGLTSRRGKKVFE